MRKLWIGMAVLLSFWAVRGDARAQVSIPSAQGIISLCDSEDQRNQSFCAGYLSSIIHFLALTPSRLAPRGLCLPPDAGDITIRRVYDLVGEQIRAQPENANLSAIQVVARAMSNAYPCSGAATPAQGAQTPPAAEKAPPAAEKTPPKVQPKPRKSDFPD